MEFSRQEYRSGLPFPTLGDLPNPGIKPVSLTSSTLAGRLFITGHLGSPSIFMSIPISQFIHPLFSLLSIHFFLYVCLYFCLANKIIYTIFLHSTYMLNVYFFSLSDLIHSVWQSLASHTSLQMTQFHSFLWLSNIPLYMCATFSLSILLWMLKGPRVTFIQLLKYYSSGIYLECPEYSARYSPTCLVVTYISSSPV